MTNVYDLELFRRLNDQYRDRPLVKAPPRQARASFEAVAEKRIATLSSHVEVAGCRVLELGTGRGYTAARLATVAGAAHVTGIDIQAYPDWEQHDAEKTAFVVGDLASEELVEPGAFDVVVSAVVLEHVTRPLRMLQALHRSLRDDGTAWLYFNLHRGPKASHRYRQLFFPWPHLLFDDVQAEQVLREAGVRGTFAWVNRMTVGNYLQACVEIGFEVTTVRRHATRLEDHLDFYARFEDKLGRYPALDLETDFLTLVLRKLPEPRLVVPAVGYIERQVRFDRLLAAHRGAAAEPAGPDE